VKVQKSVKHSKEKEKTPVGRRQRALLTRRRMLRAAHDLFCRCGYAGTTMDAIAAAAGVAVQTLYFTFHTKSAVLEETLGAAIVGFDRWDPDLEAAALGDARRAFADFPWFGAVERATTAREALRVFLDASMDIFERAAPLVLVQSAAAASDRQVQNARDLAERRRVEGYGFLVEKLIERGPLRPGVSQRRACDVLLTILSAETHQQLRARRGWSVRDCRDWFAEILERELCG
jgi:AcrR family transcriptional regulator